MSSFTTIAGSRFLAMTVCRRSYFDGNQNILDKTYCIGIVNDTMYLQINPPLFQYWYIYKGLVANILKIFYKIVNSVTFFKDLRNECLSCDVECGIAIMQICSGIFELQQTNIVKRNYVFQFDFWFLQNILYINMVNIYILSRMRRSMLQHFRMTFSTETQKALTNCWYNWAS